MSEPMCPEKPEAFNGDHCNDYYEGSECCYCGQMGYVDSTYSN